MVFRSLVKRQLGEAKILYDLNPHTRPRGRPKKLSFDEAYNSILKVARTGMQWRQLKSESVSFITVFKHFQKWVKEDIFQKAYDQMLLLSHKARKPAYFCIDSTFVKNVYGKDCVGRNPTDRGRKATKLSTVVDDRGTPYAFLASGANESDMKLLEPTLKNMLIRVDAGMPLFADKGYDSKSNRKIAVRYGFKDRILKRRTKNGRRTHAKRGVVERFFSWQDKYRRLLVRYESYCHSFMAFVFLAAGNLISNRSS